MAANYGRDAQAGENQGQTATWNNTVDEYKRRKAAGEDWSLNEGSVFGDAMRENNPRLNFMNPGSADYGGAPDMADWYRQNAREHMGDNDAQQAATKTGLMGAYAGMRGQGGAQASENAFLSGREGQSRNQQMEALGLMNQAASGNAPSVAAYQTKIGQQDALSNYVGAAGGARGLGALAGGQASGSAATGLASGNLGMAGATARGNEIAQELGQYGKTSGQVAGQDLTRLGMSNQMSQFNAGLGNDWRLGNANLAAGYGQLDNQQRGIDQAWFGQSMQPADIQFQMDQEAAQWEAQAGMDKALGQISRQQDKEAARNQLAGGIAQAGLTAIGSLAGPAGAALGGVAGGMANSAIGASTRKYY